MKLEDLEESDQGRDSPSLKQNGIPASVQINLEPIQIAPVSDYSLFLSSLLAIYS